MTMLGIKSSVAATILLSSQAMAAWSFTRGEHLLELGGSFRTIVAGLDAAGLPTLAPTEDAVGVSQSLLRLTAEGTQAQWLKYQVHTVFQWSFLSERTLTLGTQNPASARRYQAFRLSRRFLSSAQVLAAVELDRLNLKLALPHVDVTLGRQPINFSKSYFWSPLDLFLPFDPRTLDRDYKPGVDAARVDVQLGELSGINVVAASGSDLTLNPGTQSVNTSGDFFRGSVHGSALLVRAFTSIGGSDVSAQAGKAYASYHAGLGGAGELSGFGVRGELAYFIAHEPDSIGLVDSSGGYRRMEVQVDHLRAALGVDRRWESGLYVALEYGFNGAGAGPDAVSATLRQQSGETPNRGRHLIGLLATYELLPVLLAKLGSVTSVSDGSVLLNPGVSYSVSDEAELVVGAMLGLGASFHPVSRPVGTEFGAAPDLYFAEIKVYF